MSYKYLTKTVSDCAATFAQPQENPENWQATCRDLGNLLQGMGRFEEAIIWHSLALESQPNKAEIYGQLGRLYALEEDWDAAIAFFEDALKSQPKSVPIYTNLAQIYGQMGKREFEIACWYKAVELNPDLVNAQGYLKLAQAMEEQGKLPEARKCYKAACEREANLLVAYYKLAEMEFRQGDLDQAKTFLEHIIQQDFNQPQAHYQLGNILSNQKEFETAIQEFNHTIKLAPDFAQSYFSLVQVLIKQEKWDEAISNCHSILNLVDEFTGIYSLLGNALRGKGKISEAVEAYQKACAGMGWEECLTNNYFFPIANFIHSINLFDTHLSSLANGKNLLALEVGNDFGMSACWLLDKILTHPSAKLVCIDNPINKYLAENISRTGAKDRVTLQEGNIPKRLASLKPLTIDIAHLQYRHRQCKYVNDNTALAWKAMKVGGIMIFSGYGWQNPGAPDKDVKKGVDLFLQSVEGNWEKIAHYPGNFKLIIRKIAQSDD